MRSPPALPSEISPSSPASLSGENEAFAVPDCLNKLVQITTRPYANYGTLQLSREQRFRKLLRRLTNQIQYGCKNRYCEVPTCLSYRKRLSNGPLRPYSDVAARALAWKCLEQYANHGRDLDYVIDDSLLKKGGRTTSRANKGAEFCWSEPMVPWYEDPNEYFRKTKAVSRQSPNVLPTRSPSGNVEEPAKQEKAKGKELEKSVRQSIRKDPASFTQFLFDAPRLRTFDESYQNSDLTSSHEEDPDSSNPQPKYVRLSVGNLSHVHTFRILPASAVLWLRAQLRVQDYESPVGQFAQQSAHYALSHPLRLIESANTWDCFWRSETESSTNPDIDLDARVESMDEMQHGMIGNIHEVLPSWDSMERISLALKVICGRNGATTLANHLFAALQHAYVLPSWLKLPQLGVKEQDVTTTGVLSNTLEQHSDSFPEPTFLTGRQVTHVILLAIGVIKGVASHMPGSSDILQAQKHDQYPVIHPSSFVAARGTGPVYPQPAISQMYRHLPEHARITMSQDYLRFTFCDSDPSFTCLSDTIADIISHRLALANVVKTTDFTQHNFRNSNIVDELIEMLFKPPVLIEDNARFVTMDYSLRMLIFMQGVLLAKWDRRPIVLRVGPVGGALEMLAGMYRRRQQLQFDAGYFQMQFIANNLDEVDMPYEWLSFREDNKKMHILQFAFLFDPATLVKYFRAINLKIMQHAHEHALAVYINAKSYLVHTLLPVYGVREILDKIRPHMARYFVMTISRQNVLEDAINQVWRREQQELLRPLKVRVGKDEGEDGLDHGGVQQEFFRLVFAEALDPNLGLFTIDETTRMTWFHPGSMEPLYKFEALGVLMSLAVYNAITLPLTLPSAFYRKLLNLKVKTLEHIEDGWPALSRNLQALLDWDDGDVSESIMRTYEFSYEAFGTVVTIDMQKVGRDDPWPVMQRKRPRGNVKTASFEFPPSPSGTPPENSPTSKPTLTINDNVMPETRGTSTPLSLESEDNEAGLVTNANRQQYVKDYIFWLTNKSVRPQFEAFAKGFYTCLDRTALSIFTPEALKHVVEGHQEIDIDGLERTASYDDYEADDTIIRDFWNVVRDLSPEQHCKLLEFVTASDRVPVNGIESITFTIQKNGEGDDRLPSSSTCYGRLLLPHYSSKEVLKTKLEKAIENSLGFGSL